MHPDTMYQIAKIRLAEDLHTVEAYRLAELVGDNQPNRAAALLNHMVAFAKRVGSKRIELTQTGEVPAIELSGEQS